MLPPDYIDKLNNIIADLYGGWHFYTQAAIVVEGKSRPSLQQDFQRFAQKNIFHITQLGELLLFAGGYPTTKVNGWRADIKDPAQIIDHATKKEKALHQEIAKLIVNPTHLRYHALCDVLISRIVHLDSILRSS